MKNSHLLASPVCLNSQIRSQGMYNMQHLSEALAILWAHLTCQAAEANAQCIHEFGKCQALTMMWPQGQCQHPALQQGRKR